ncbi:unnamed protein product [Tuber melanosporum]|uniref:(Perigord truffle) hypothetical protein n=1 Tax=Tuber melanosporum (strain Mel28) TaxID=656061 RepID=D5G447_TUBMM|nr:unnamed protein product [Tuber melanosporum]
MEANIRWGWGWERDRRDVLVQGCVET